MRSSRLAMRCGPNAATSSQTANPGEHEAIIPDDLFRRVQARLHQNRNAGNIELRNRYGAFLRRLLYCKACGRVMVHTFTSRGNKRYRYYTCTNAIKNGRRKCPTMSLPAGEIEKAIVDQIRCIGQDSDLLGETLRQARSQAEEAIERLMNEQRIIKRGLARCHAEMRRTATSEPATSSATVRIADLTDQITQSERRLAEIDGQLVGLRHDLITETDIAAAFADFDNVWMALSPREQVRLINLLVHRAEFAAADSSIEVSFYSSGIKTLATGDDDEPVPREECCDKQTAMPVIDEASPMRTVIRAAPE